MVQPWEVAVALQQILINWGIATRWRFRPIIRNAPSFINSQNLLNFVHIQRKSCTSSKVAALTERNCWHQFLNNSFDIHFFNVAWIHLLWFHLTDSPSTTVASD
jgi:hypothetical protein